MYRSYSYRKNNISKCHADKPRWETYLVEIEAIGLPLVKVQVGDSVPVRDRAGASDM
jgi:hypothetical protein